MEVSNLSDVTSSALRNEVTRNQIKAKLCKDDFASFIKEFWSEITADKLLWNWHLDYLADVLSNLAKDVSIQRPKKHDIIINIPPGSTKSITCSVMFPVWCWINWYWMRFICSSYSSTLSLEHAEASRELVRSRKFQRLFPGLKIKRDKDQKSNFRLELTNELGNPVLGGSRFSTSVGGAITGFHGHILIVDDPLDPQGSDSDKERATANRWMSQTLSTRKVNKRTTPTILIMQRLHEMDCTGYMLENRSKENIFHICIPGEIRGYREQVSPPELLNYYKDGLFDPGRLDDIALKEAQDALGQYGYAGQIGQSPVPPTGGMFKVDKFLIMDHPPPPNEIKISVRYWDKAGTDRRSNPDACYTCGVKMVRLTNGRFVITDVVRGQWEASEREKIIKNQAELDGFKTLVYVEQEPGSGGKESAQETIKSLAGFIVYADKPVGDKVFRADPFSVQVNSGNVVLVNGDWNRDFKDELKYFPFSKTKDQVDAASAAFAQVVAKKQVRVII